jgi:electron transfer flavoprotein alpha subunit
MAEVLVVVEASSQGGVKKVTLEMLTLARTLGGDVAAVVLGGSADALAEKLGEYGATKIYAAAGADLDEYLVAPKATVLAGLIQRVSPSAVLLASTQEGKEIAARVAVKLDNGVLTDVVALEADGTATQVVFAGSTIVKSKVTKGLPIVTVRPNSLTPAPAPATPAVEAVEVAVEDRDKLAKVVERKVEAKGARPELAEASAARTTSSWSRSWPTCSAAPWARPARPSTPASTRTSSRSARPARRCLRSCTSRSASPARSSTEPACRPRRPSSR